MAKHGDGEVLMQRLMRRLTKAINSYHLIDDGDRLLVGLSGGKDSMALLELLAERQRIYKPRFSVVAVHVAMPSVGYCADTDYLRSFAERLGVEFHVVETSYTYSPSAGKPHCFLCSWHRRKALFAAARDFGCNKLALGHHMDDILATLFLNMVYAGNPEPMQPRLQMRRFSLCIIRPLCLIREVEIEQFAALREYRKPIGQCPYEHVTRRDTMRNLLARIESVNPEAAPSLWRCVEKLCDKGADGND